LTPIPKVSVVVPVYNPGTNMDDLIRSLLGQTLTPDELELIFVDDGSTDGTQLRLDALAADFAHIHVEHLPNSGWPGKPRNVGLARARGEFVFFADNDDWLERDALERMHDMAVADGADIVIGKVVGHGKYVPPGLFKKNRHNVSLRDAPLVALLAPHKLFRRRFVEVNRLRFPEGRRRLEDHVFVLQAYFATDRVSVLADHPCYHWMRRGAKNASSGDEWDPAQYYAAVREVLDIVDANTEPGEFRDRLYLRWYRAKTLGRVGGSRSAITTRSPEWQRKAFDEVRAIVAERFDERLDTLLPAAERERARLVRAGDFDGLLARAHAEARTAARGELLQAEDNDIATVLHCRLELTDAPELDGNDGWAQVLVRAVGSKDQHVLPANVTPLGGGAYEIQARLDPSTAAAGGPLEPGAYDHPVVVSVGGLVGDGVLTGRLGLPVATVVTADGSARVRTTSGRVAGLAIARRMPRLARAVKRMARR
jgi:glycosyltransferase involved in cell wall biosynthesis